MTFRRRLDRLDRTLRAAQGDDPCPTCGREPGKAYPGVVLVRGKPIERSCPECGLLVDADGLPLGSEFEDPPRVKYIVLPPLEESEPD